MASRDSSFHPKKVLITQSSLCNICGSEIVCLEIAQFLQSMGAIVKVYTWRFNEPMRSIFKASKIEVTTSEDDPYFKECDLIWVHHQVLPQLIIDQFTHDKNAHKNLNPVFIFLHMSSLEEILIEQPYIYQLENKIASKVLYVSEETRDNLAKLGYPSQTTYPQAIFANPAPPPQFTNLTPSQSTLGKVLIVSNHIPKELLDTKKILLAHGVEVKTLGQYEEDHALVTPKLLSKYYVIITIGKTVQYCLIGGKPVYI